MSIRSNREMDPENIHRRRRSANAAKWLLRRFENLPATLCAAKLGEDGQSMVEFALVMPLMLVAITGVIAFGLVLNNYEILTGAVNDGARAFALSTSENANGSTNSLENGGDPCAYAVTTIKNAAAALNQSNLTITITYTTSGGTATNFSTTTSGGSTSWPSCAGQPENPNDSVSVSAKYPMTPMMFGWGSRQLNLTAQSTEQIP